MSISESLKRSLLSHLNKKGFGKDHTNSIRNYTLSSWRLNIPLLHGLPLDPQTQAEHSNLLDSAHQSGENFHVYTGSHVNLGKLAMNSKDGVLHLPTHLSTSLEHHVAHGFGDHTAKIHVKSTDLVISALEHTHHSAEKR